MVAVTSCGMRASFNVDFDAAGLCTRLAWIYRMITVTTLYIAQMMWDIQQIIWLNRGKIII